MLYYILCDCDAKLVSPTTWTSVIRVKSLIIVNIGDLRQFSRQVLGAVKAVVGEYRQPKCNTVSNPQPVADVVCVLYSVSQKSDAIEDYSITYINFYPIKHDFASV